MGIVIVILVVIAIIAIRAWLEAENRPKEKSRSPGVASPVRRQGREGLELLGKARNGLLNITWKDDVYHPSDGGDPLALKRIMVSGAIPAPAPDYPVRFTLSITDVSDDLSRPMPVFSAIDDLADEDGAFSFELDTEVPYEFSLVASLNIVTIPPAALTCPRQGPRRLRIDVVLVPRKVPHPFDPFEPPAPEKLAEGHADVTLIQEGPGYLDIVERIGNRERNVALLALAVSAADGQIAAVEKRVIRSFFARRFADMENAEQRREKIEHELQETVRRLQSGSQRVNSLLTETLQQLAEDGAPDVCQAAYELCVRVVAADERAEKQEQLALRKIAQKLKLPNDFVREVHDRHLNAVVDFADEDEELLVGMPRGLSDDEKRKWLNRRYRELRHRVTHPDPKIATHASMQLAQIARLRQELDRVRT